MENTKPKDRGTPYVHYGFSAYVKKFALYWRLNILKKKHSTLIFLSFCNISLKQTLQNVKGAHDLASFTILCSKLRDADQQLSEW